MTTSERVEVALRLGAMPEWCKSGPDIYEVLVNGILVATVRVRTQIYDDVTFFIKAARAPMAFNIRHGQWQVAYALAAMVENFSLIEPYVEALRSKELEA